MIGTFAPALFSVKWQDATLLGVSMIPRGEIAMVIMQRGRYLGDWAVSESAFAAMIVVSAVTSILAPLCLRPLLVRWPQFERF